MSLFRILPFCLGAATASAIAADHAAVIRSEFIYEKAPFPQCHASTIIEPTPGHLIAAWFGGTREKNPDVGIWVSLHNVKAWSAPF